MSQLFKFLSSSSLSSRIRLYSKSRYIHTNTITPSVDANLSSFFSSYRKFGHLKAKCDPLQLQEINEINQNQLNYELNPINHGLNHNQHYLIDGQEYSLNQIINHLESVYCNSIGAEYEYIVNSTERKFLMDRLEGNKQYSISPAEQRNSFNLMYSSQLFDEFMGIKFTSFKRYGLEGNETALPAIQTLFTQASTQGVKSVTIGMPHRGRLNLLVSLLDLPARALFSKVKGKSLIPAEFSGHCDVASHIARSVTKKFDSTNPLSVSLLHNPSHLEAVNPVAMGKTRCKQDELMQDDNINQTEARKQALCLQIHGDAAFAGQGVNTESLMMSYLPYFHVGGTIHLIINNQLGFTTGAARYRSSQYSSDLCKIIQMPVFHVNAEDIESVLKVCKLAVDYRLEFNKDIMIDLIGFRKHGHNEVDEPSFTQPKMYNNIRSRKSIVTKYSEKLQAAGLVNQASIDKLKASLSGYLENELTASNTYKPENNEHFQGKWANIKQAKTTSDEVKTGYNTKELTEIVKASIKLPEGFQIHSRLNRGHIEPRINMANTGNNYDWATAEAMAWGSLMQQGYNIRISGQDVDRGTFSQRHTVLIDQNNETRYSPLQSAGYKGHLHSVNSHLSEFAVLGYEFGYSWDSPKTLNIWEAQFGDFNNGAQIIIDQFITSTESKWLRASGLVVLLPHGYDGAGPEHSSSRIERFLQLTDNKFQYDPNHSNNEPVNVIIANVTTPAQYFHILRRQQIRNYRKPLIMASPKTLLRHDQAVSNIQDFNENTQFHPVLSDSGATPSKTQVLVFVSGKVYYELSAKRTVENRSDIAFIRIEELSPFPFNQIKQQIEYYLSESKSGIKNIIWFQEEPQNGGCWNYIESRINSIINSNNKLQKLGSITYSGRTPIAAAGAVGSGVAHKAEVEQIFKQLFQYPNNNKKL